MFKVKCKIAQWCSGNDRDYFRKPKETIFPQSFNSREEAEDFIEKQKAIHTNPEKGLSKYSDYEIIEDLEENVDIYKKDQQYNIIYSDQDGKDKEYKYTPEEDMTKPKMIMKCKEANKDFVKLKEIKKLEEGYNKMEENKTLADLIESRYKEGLGGLDIGDNTIDMVVYFDYDPESNDIFDKCLSTIAQGTKIVREDEDYAVVDLYNYVIDHLNAFTNNFTINIDPADGEDNETIAANIVEGILPGLFSGYTNDHTYNSLDSDLLGVKTNAENISQENIHDHSIKTESRESDVKSRIEKAKQWKQAVKDAQDESDLEEIVAEIIESSKDIKDINYAGEDLYDSISNVLDDSDAASRGSVTYVKSVKTNMKNILDDFIDNYEDAFGDENLEESKEVKIESFESNKEFSAGEILAVIDRYIDSDDIPHLFDRMGIDQAIYEGDAEIPEGKIQDIIEQGLAWLSEHLQDEDYRRVLKDDLEMTDEEMEKYGVELEESKKIEEDKANGIVYNIKLNIKNMENDPAELKRVLKVLEKAIEEGDVEGQTFDKEGEKCLEFTSDEEIIEESKKIQEAEISDPDEEREDITIGKDTLHPKKGSACAEKLKAVKQKLSDLGLEEYAKHFDVDYPDDTKVTVQFGSKDLEFGVGDFDFKLEFNGEGAKITDKYISTAGNGAVRINQALLDLLDKMYKAN